MVKLVIFSMKNLLSSIRRHQLGAKDLLTPTSFYQKTEQQTTLTLLMGSVNMRIPESKGQKAVHACMIRHLNQKAPKHGEEAICDSRVLQYPLTFSYIGAILCIV